MKKVYILLKYKFASLIEEFPRINFFVLNNLRFIKFLLPHDKDYLGLKLICANNLNLHIVDIGGNMGSSILSFRSLGLKNKIFVFEPNILIFNKYLKKLKSKDPNIEIFNYALGNKNEDKKFYIPFYKNICLHTYSSFDLPFLQKGLKKSMPKVAVSIQERIIKVKKFDNLSFNIKPHLIKIDAEGYEIPILKGMLRSIIEYKPILLIEYNFDSVEEIQSILSKYQAYYYDIKLNKFFKLCVRKKASLRNIFFMHKDFRY